MDTSPLDSLADQDFDMDILLPLSKAALLAHDAKGANMLTDLSDKIMRAYDDDIRGLYQHGAIQPDNIFSAYKLAQHASTIAQDKIRHDKQLHPALEEFYSFTSSISDDAARKQVGTIFVGIYVRAAGDITQALTPLQTELGQLVSTLRKSPSFRQIRRERWDALSRKVESVLKEVDQALHPDFLCTVLGERGSPDDVHFVPNQETS